MNQTLTLSTFIVAAFAIFGGTQAEAQLVTLQNTPSQSVLAADANDNAGHNMSQSENVNSLPYLTPISAVAGTATASVTPDLSSSAFDLSFTSSQPNDGASSEAYGTIYFEPTSDVQFAISGETGGPDGGEMTAELRDITTNTYLVNYVGDASGSTPLFIDSSGGALTGMLQLGDVYEFRALQTVDDAGSSTGYDDIIFTPVPEASTWALMLGGLMVLGCYARWKTLTQR